MAILYNLLHLKAWIPTTKMRHLERGGGKTKHVSGYVVGSWIQLLCPDDIVRNKGNDKVDIRFAELGRDL